MDEKEKFLTNAYDNNEANIIVATLEASGIKAIVKNTGVGASMNIIMGTSIGTIEIYVPEEQYDEASELLSLTPEEEDKDYELVKKEYCGLRSVTNIFFKIFVVVGILAVLVQIGFVLYQVITNL